jgi:RNA polymerase sigma-70 factor (ECF subfamily)
LTQAFFAKFLKRNYLEGLSSERGRFRAFLLACLKHFLANEWNKSQRIKRGGAATHLSLDWESAEERYKHEPQDITSPDRLYDREWALALLERVLARLKAEYHREGKAALFEHSREFLTGGSTESHARAALALGLGEGAVRVAVHRLRKRYRQTLTDEIRQTLANPEAVEEELRSLQQALREVP